MTRRTLPATLALWVALLGGLLVALTTGFAYWTLAHELEKQDRDHLSGKFEQVKHALAEMPDVKAVRLDPHRLADILIGHSELHIVISDAAAQEPILTFGAFAKESLGSARRAGDGFVAWQTSSGASFLSLAGTTPVGNGEAVTVVVSEDRRDGAQLLGAFLRAAIIALPFALAVVALQAWWIARIGLKSLEQIRRVASSIMPHDISQRLNEAGLPIELKELARAFNTMLDRLDEGVKRLSEFSGDIAHELRTPISNLLGKTQVTLSHPREADEYRAVLESNAEEFGRLSRLVSDMLFLAQSDDAQAALHCESIEVGDEVSKVVAFFEILAEERGVLVSTEGAATIYADRLLIQRAASNILSNAIRHAARGSTIEVRVQERPLGTTISMANVGETIPTEHLAHLFDRFYRVDRSRSRAEGGTGLGLALVKSIMALHGGDATVTTEPRGKTIFSLNFPSGAARPPQRP